MMNRSCHFLLMTVAMTGALRADHLLLAGEARLSGVVRSIDDDGVVELQTPLAAEPVLLRAEAVRKVTFSEAAGVVKIPSARVELVNGDVLPVEVESLDETLLNVVSPVAGKLRIPRGAVKALQLGIHPNRVVYSGPKTLEDFHADEPNAENWAFNDGVLSIEGSGRLEKLFTPLRQFIVRFTMEWENTPAFQCYFADPLAAASQAADRYVFQFTDQGIEIKRESMKGRRFTTLVTLNRRPEQYDGNRLKVEIRVDRENSLLQLFLNDEPEGRYQDPVAKAAIAGGIAFVSSGGNDSALRLSQVEVLEWDQAGDRRRTDERGDAKTDALIEKHGDRFGGRLLSIRESAGGQVFSFKSDFQNEPVELPESEISTVFFQQAEMPSAEAEAVHPFALRLRGDGVLRVSKCAFPGDRIEAVHPLLGPLTFSRDGVMALERLDGKGEAP
jgi:hypothetical protein